MGNPVTVAQAKGSLPQETASFAGAPNKRLSVEEHLIFAVLVVSSRHAAPSVLAMLSR